MCSVNLEHDACLRPANMKEVIAADRKVWGTIRDMIDGGWSLHDAFFEITTIRADLPSLLQPRPKPAKGQGKGNACASI